MTRFKSEFDLGEPVYLKTDPEQLEHMIIGVAFYVDNGMSYLVASGESRYWVHELELSYNKTF